MAQEAAEFDLSQRERHMRDRFWAYFYRTAAICGVANALIIGSIYKYSHHPNPTIASLQLMLPLIMWEFLLILSFCPTEIIEYYLQELLLEEDLRNLDLALLHLPGHRLRFPRGYHSAGDVTLRTTSSATPVDFTNRATDNTSSERFLTERHFSSPFLLTERQ